MEQEMRNLGGDWNDTWDRQNPLYPPKRNEVILVNLKNDYTLIEVTDVEAILLNMRNDATSKSIINYFIMKISRADRMESSPDLATTSDHVIV